ncbi:hypothetical protein [Methanobrevibacter sp.]|uniref:hypothetical protein n=1 Tax=Methanobrevibacter sp. TaxID=66852 RepID=UPI00386FAFB4
MSFSRLKNIFSSKPKKPHLLIAGVDLKFIVPAIKYLEKYYEIKVDEWDWNTDKEVSSKSIELLKWADIILCEWMEYYAPWYSKNVSKDQKLFIRAHRYEITLDYGSKINFENVCGVITINYFLLEIFSNVFRIPREKMFVLNNFIETSIYGGVKNNDYSKHIALVGYAPSYKGYMRALDILNQLKEHDDFKLYLYGKDYTQMHWKDNPEQIEYFNACDEFIEENNLGNSIVNRGWVERNDMFQDIGYVLSLSDIEGSHLSPTEAFADSTISLLIKWPGVEYVYPKELIFDGSEEIVRFILDTYSDSVKYSDISSKLRKYCIDEFGEEYFADGLKEIFNKSNSNNSKTVVSFKDPVFENVVLIDSEDEIPNIVRSNEKVSLMISSNVESHRIKNIYQRFASPDVKVYSQKFFDNLDDANAFIELCNEIHGSEVSFF